MTQLRVIISPDKCSVSSFRSFTCKSPDEPMRQLWTYMVLIDSPENSETARVAIFAFRA